MQINPGLIQQIKTECFSKKDLVDDNSIKKAIAIIQEQGENLNHDDFKTKIEKNVRALDVNDIKS